MIGLFFSVGRGIKDEPIAQISLHNVEELLCYLPLKVVGCFALTTFEPVG